MNDLRADTASIAEFAAIAATMSVEMQAAGLGAAAAGPLLLGPVFGVIGRRFRRRLRDSARRAPGLHREAVRRARRNQRDRARECRRVRGHRGGHHGRARRGRGRAGGLTVIPIDLLTRPILDLLGAFGSGVLPAGGPADALRASSIAIDAVHDTGRTGISSIYGDWQGKGGTGAIVKTEEAQRATVAVSDRGNDMAAVVAEASEIVRAGMLQLQEILQSFISLAVAAGPALVTPPGQAMIVAAALDHLGRATAVVAKVRAELAEQTGKMVTLTPAEDIPSAPAATAPASTTAASTAPASAAPVAPAAPTWSAVRRPGS